jgi:RNA-binding protein YlmH
MHALCCTGNVRVNWRSGAKASSDVKAGDVISVSGKGRVEVRECMLTKKGKWVVKLVRFI